MKTTNPIFSLKNFRSFGEEGADFELAANWLSKISFALGGARNLLKYDFLKSSSGWKGF